MVKFDFESRSTMKKCKTCNAAIAKNAKTCPSCGDRNKKPLYNKWWVWVIAIFLFFAIPNIYQDSTLKTSTAKNSNLKQVIAKLTPMENALNQAIEVDYKVLHKDYIDNPIGADSKYKDKYLKLTGNIKSIDREIAGNPFITFEISFLNDIRITFNKSEEGKVGELQKGTPITIVGKCKGTLLTTTVSLTDCYIVK